MRAFCLGLMFVALSLAGCDMGAERSGDVLRAGEKIDAPFLEAYAQRMAGEKEYAGGLTPELVLERVQNMDALIAEGRDQGLSELPQFRQAVHQFKGELLMRALQPDLVPEIPRDMVTDEEVRAFFDANKEIYSLPDLYTATLLVAHEKARLEEMDDPREWETSRGEEVELRTVQRRPLSALSAPWREELLKMEEGEISPVLSHEDQWVRIRLDGVERERLQDFEARKEFIRNDLIFSRYRALWQEAYSKLREKHGVIIDDAVAEAFKADFVNPLQEEGEDDET